MCSPARTQDPYRLVASVEVAPVVPTVMMAANLARSRRSRVGAPRVPAGRLVGPAQAGLVPPLTSAWLPIR